VASEDEADASCDILKLARREAASEADQKLTTTLFPLRKLRDWDEEDERVREGASCPISSLWLPVGMDEERNAATTNEKNKFLEFTTTCFRYTIVHPHQLLTLFMDEQ